MRSLLIFSLIPIFLVGTLAETLLPPDPFSVDDIKLDLSKDRPITGEVNKDDKKDVKKDDKKDEKKETKSETKLDESTEDKKKDDKKEVKKEVKKDVKKDEKKETKSEDKKSDDEKSGVEVTQNTPVVLGNVSSTTIDKETPTLKSDKKEEEDDEDEEDDDKKISKKSNTKDKPNFIDVPDNILKSVEKKEEPNLRVETAKVKLNEPEKDKKPKKAKKNKNKDKKETKSETKSDESTEDDSIIKSIEGAEKQLSEAFGAVKTKLSEGPTGHKPIKVDCGTTRVRVVCSKKKEEATTETEKPTPESDEKKEENSETEETSNESDENKEPEETEESTGEEEET